MAEKHIDKYPHFVENQVLRSSTLNDSFAFVDEQTRLSRVHLMGSGIVEGLGFSDDKDSLTIHSGVAVDSDGWMVKVSEDTEYRYAVTVPQSDEDFTSDSLESILQNGGSRIAMVCFKTEDDVRELGLEPVSISDVDLNNYVIAIAFGRKNETTATCSQNKCDINVVNQILEPWPVLIPVSEIQYLYRKIEPVSLVVLPQKGPSIENWHGDIARFNEEVRASHQAWKSELDYAMECISSRILFQSDAEAVSSSPWDGVFTDSRTLITRFMDVRKKLRSIDTAEDGGIPDWYFSFYEDMLTAINEFTECYNEFAGRYNYIPDHLPSDRLLYLGSGSDASSEGLYRSLFKSAIDESYQRDCSKLQKMLTRICVLSERFICDEAGIAACPFKILKVRSGKCLSDRPVPFYYDTEGDFFEFWNADKSSSARCVDDYTDDGRTDRLRNPESDDSAAPDGYRLYPVAYQGKEWTAVKEGLETLNKNGRLSIDIEEAGLRSVEGLSNANAGILVKVFQPIDCLKLKDSLVTIKKNTSGMAAGFAGFISDILTDEDFINNLGLGRTDYRGSYKEVSAIEQIGETEVWEIVEEIKKSSGASENTYPKKKDSSEVYAAFRQLILVCRDSFFVTPDGDRPDGFGRVVFMGPLSRGSKVYCFTKSLSGSFEKDTPRTVVSYGVDYTNPAAAEEEETSYTFRIALTRAEKGKKLADLPDVVSPYGDDGRWSRVSDKITIYPCTGDASKHLYSTDTSNIISDVSDPKVLSVVMDEVADVEDCIPAVGIQMLKNGTSTVTLKLRDDEGNILHTRTFTVAVNNPEWNKKPVTGVSVSQTSVSGMAGQTCQLSASVSPANADNKGIIWSTSNPAVANVDQNGKITFIAAGTAQITVTSVDGAKTASADINVSSLLFRMMINRTEDGEYLSDFPNIVSPYGDDGKWAIINGNIAVYPHIYDGSQKLGYGTDSSNILYEVSDSDILSVGSGYMTIGKVKTPAITMKLLKNGTSKVTLKIKDDSGTILHTRTFTVNVNNPEWNKVAVTGVSLSTHQVQLVKSSTTALKCTVTPANATNKSVIWSSGASDVATVDQKGTVTGHKEGVAKIKVTATEGSFTDTAAVTVVSLGFRMELQNSENNSKLAQIPGAVTLNGGDGRWFVTSDKAVHIYPCAFNGSVWSYLNIGNNKITCVIGDSTVLSYSLSSFRNASTVTTVLSLKMLKAGSTRVTLTLSDSTGRALVSQSFTAIVSATKVAVTGVTLPFSTKSMIAGQKCQLSATVLPSNATNKKVTWTSASKSVAAIDQNGVLLACGAGSARILARTEDGSKTASATVNVSSLLFWMQIQKPVNGKKLAAFPDTVSPYGDDGKWAVIGKDIVVVPQYFDGKQTLTYATNTSNIIYEVSKPDVLSITLGRANWDNAQNAAVIVISLLKKGVSKVTLKIKDDSGTILHTRTFTVNVVK